ncbi:hypothetical protein Bbelb_269460 [Branchiostoma belcheri]|nr:hypothetical protein Bbelb_269460 [Branchiostoma belcheri]
MSVEEAKNRPTNGNEYVDMNNQSIITTEYYDHEPASAESNAIYQANDKEVNPTCPTNSPVISISDSPSIGGERSVKDTKNYNDNTVYTIEQGSAESNAIYQANDEEVNPTNPPAISITGTDSPSIGEEQGGKDSKNYNDNTIYTTEPASAESNAIYQANDEEVNPICPTNPPTISITGTDSPSIGEEQGGKDSKNYNDNTVYTIEQGSAESNAIYQANDEEVTPTNPPAISISGTDSPNIGGERAVKGTKNNDNTIYTTELASAESNAIYQANDKEVKPACPTNPPVISITGPDSPSIGEERTGKDTKNNDNTIYTTEPASAESNAIYQGNDEKVTPTNPPATSITGTDSPNIGGEQSVKGTKNNDNTIYTTEPASAESNAIYPANNGNPDWSTSILKDKELNSLYPRRVADSEENFPGKNCASTGDKSQLEEGTDVADVGTTISSCPIQPNLEAVYNNIAEMSVENEHYDKDLTLSAPSSTKFLFSYSEEAKAKLDAGTRKLPNDKQAKRYQYPLTNTDGTGERSQSDTVPTTGNTAYESRRDDIIDGTTLEPYAVAHNTEVSSQSSGESARSTLGDSTFSNPMYGADVLEQATDGDKSDATDFQKPPNPPGTPGSKQASGNARKHSAHGGCSESRSVLRPCWIIAMVLAPFLIGLIAGCTIEMLNNQSLSPTQGYRNMTVTTLTATEPARTSPGKGTQQAEENTITFGGKQDYQTTNVGPTHGSEGWSTFTITDPTPSSTEVDPTDTTIGPTDTTTAVITTSTSEATTPFISTTNDGLTGLPKDSCMLENGASYRGTASVTETGKTCQRWDSQTPHDHDRTPWKYPASGLEQNYCRNPDGEDKVWCYTLDPGIRWEWCNIPFCGTIYGNPSGLSASMHAIFVTEQTKKQILIYERDGIFSQSFPTRGFSEIPRDVAVDPKDGNMWVVLGDKNDASLRKYRRNGKMLIGFSLPCSSEKTGLYTSIALDTLTDNIIVTLVRTEETSFEAQDDHKAVSIFKPGHGRVMRFGHPDLTYPNSVSVDKEGNILVVDGKNFYVYKFGKNGNYRFKFGGPGSEKGKLKMPMGSCIDGSGRLLVADNRNNRVEMFSENEYLASVRGVLLDGALNGGPVFEERQCHLKNVKEPT